MSINRLALKTIFLVFALLGFGQEGRCGLFFDFFTVHPDAVVQSTVRGRTLSSIDIFGDGLYFGYGDWAADTGPIAIRNLSPSTGEWSSPLLSVGTEAITHYRQIEGSSYAVLVDPRGLPGANPGGYAMGQRLALFDSLEPIRQYSWSGTLFRHCRGAGSDLWVVGSIGTSGAVWRSVDGGQNFTVARLDGPAPGSQPFVFSRYTGVVEFMGLQYVQRVDINGADVTSSLVFDGATWTNGPDLLSATNGFVFRPQQFDGKLVYLDGDLGSNSLYRFDGTQSSIATSQQIRDFFIKDGSLIALTAGGEIILTKDLNSWLTLGMAPANAQSLAFNSDFIFAGTSTAQVFRASFSEITAVPETSSLAMIAVAFLIAVGIRFGRTGFRVHLFIW